MVPEAQDINDVQADTSAAKVSLEVESGRVANYAMQQNDIPLIRSIRVTNTSTDPIRNATVVVTATSAVCRPLELRLAGLESGGTIRISPVDLQLESTVLANQVERELSEMRFEVRVGDEVIGAHTRPLEVLAFNQWTGTGALPELLAAFVTPNHPAIETLLGAARDALGKATDDPGLSGYQSSRPERVRAIVQAIASAVHATEVGYINPPASYEQAGQKIRTADQVLGGRLGTCLDLSVMLAAAFEQAGLHPLIMLCKEHAFVGVWTRDESFPEATIEDRSRVLKRVQLGEILVLESTGLVAGSRLGFAALEEAAEKRLTNAGDFVLAVDIRAARRSRIRPLPSRVASGTGFDVAVDPLDSATAPGNPITIDPVAGGSANQDSAKPCGTPDDRHGLGESARERLEKWKRRLLDLTLRNRLLNFLETKRAIPLLVPELGAFEDILAGGTTLALRPRPDALEGDGRDLGAEARRSGTDVPKAVLNDHLAAGRVCASLTQTELNTRLVEIFRTARTNQEESGSSSLYLALGTLFWYEPGSSQGPRIAPIILVPATIKRDADGQTYRLGLADEDARINVTLLEMLRTVFRLDGSGLDVLAEDESGFDIEGALRSFTALIKDVPRWEVRHTAHLSLFSFAKFVMWSDLELRTAAISSSPVVRRLLDHQPTASDSEPLEAHEALDLARGEDAAVCAMDADSSQVAAIRAAQRGRTFVLQGPPGTGKSQTITNILAAAIGSGKRVLFVAEKMAALGVVKNRLEKLGLGRFCLELHSVKAGKRAVLAQIGAALSTMPDGPPPAWPTEVQGLEAARDGLNEYTRALHEVRPSGESVHAAIGRLSKLNEAPRIELNLPEIAATTGTRLRDLRAGVGALATAAAAVDNPCTSPMRGIGLTVWSLQSGEDVPRAAEATRGVIERTIAALGPELLTLGNGLGAEGAAERLSYAETAWLQEVVGLITQRQAPTRDLLVQDAWDRVRPEIESALEMGRARDRDRSDLLSRWNPTFLELAHVPLRARADVAEAAGGLSRWWRRRKLRAVLASHRRVPLPAGPLPLEDFSKGDRVKLATAKLASPESVPSRVFGATWARGEANWADLTETLSWAAKLRSELALVPPPRGLGPGAVDRLVSLASGGPDTGSSLAAAQRVRGILTELHGSFDRLIAATALHRELIAGDNDPGFLSKMRLVLDGWIKGADHLAEWCAWRRAAAGLASSPLQPLVHALEAGSLAPRDVRAAFERSYATAWLTVMWSSERELGHFAHAAQVQRVDEFRQRDRTVIRMSRQVIAARASQAVPPPSGSGGNPDSEVGILRRQLSLKARQMPVRRLVQKLPNLLPRLKPCWLMSPLSVAQYLDPSLPPFDLVVFDEASQIPAWDAVGALARGADALIVGDSKQLPPTSFFAKQNDGEVDDESDFEELESVLDEAVASGLPSLDLRWHYRSRHESLIAFSNHHYYQNRLLTFPSPQERAPGLGVSLKYIPEGRYDRGKSKTNRLEAEAVRDEVIRRLLAARTGEHVSLGIVTFSMAQQQLVEDLLDRERSRRPELERFFTDESPEPVFIKNLENVQGDERDAILFSICYGPDDTGRVSVVMGPLNRDGGERRLNVAITRARREVLVVTSVRPDQIDLSRTRAIGVTHLREFLDYAERGPRALLEASAPTGGDCESPFEESVRDAIVALGYRVDTQVGCSGYRIDLAVRHPERVGSYMLGIECDGATYHSAASARDRDRLREQVLRDLGWEIHRVWSTDWMQSRKRALGRIQDAISKAQVLADSRESAVPLSPETEPPSVVSERAPELAQILTAAPAPTAPAAAEDLFGAVRTGPGQPYQRHRFDDSLRTSDFFYMLGSNGRIAADITAVIETESPIHRELLLHRVADAWRIQRVTARCRERFDQLLGHLHQTGQVRMHGDVAWSNSQDPAKYAGFRVPSPNDAETRGVELVPVQELANAVAAVLAREISLPRSALQREVCRLFGLLRVTGRLEAAVDYGIRGLAERGGCRIDKETVSLP